MAIPCGNDPCPTNAEIDETSPPVLMTGKGRPPRYFCSHDCLYEYVLHDLVSRGKVGQDVLDGYRRDRRAWRS